LLNNFTYQLELNELSKTDTKQKLKDKISKYNQEAFRINAGCKIELYLPWYSHTQNDDKATSKMLNFKLLQLAIEKYISIYNIDDLPIYAQQLFKINFIIQLKENLNG
jgi:hypothetical protein